MAFEIAVSSTFATSYHGPIEFADLTADSPVMDFGAPMSRFRVTILLKAGTGAKTFSLQGADDVAMTQNVRAVGDYTLNMATNPGMIVQFVAVRGACQYGRILLSGGGATYDVRMEWNNV